ncbi:phosphatidylserine/phosphatidylglycerophosphate/cardiolipin synthase-like enzyme [Actinoplanes lutulentus]|uniref:Phosphatidylserine/phosphatidylglycerophosphate/ cardiolipin synthase-like enzyme n=1 Tax=Actinoplanes lutulentus TaxID=1287878 RepID=A0A327ZJ25_9ACTN|nr:phospholipase D-like domain-containing protein [Actinoplanes lutulentus]MBB2940666.1 phosphatidylserine/phosphatidylglycerophosphate/cardiolipin synthase-like enzyme [Actinoplanes lutulentus]RAK42977.1 phosphatidylserine/phosphatidylglycerophosphate/cardiolipin synthase-like enzyme [Actinoplanes lutulentus]
MSHVPSLTDLIARYLPPATEACPTFAENSRFEPIIDGVTYFTELAAHLEALGPGDGVYIAGYQVDPHLDLTGRVAGEAGYRPFTDVLAEKAADGTDVRIVLSAAEYPGGGPWLPIGPFLANTLAARVIRAWKPSTRETGPTLENRVLLDWSGPALGSNHQKLVVFSHGGVLTAYVGGLDLSPSRFDHSPHRRLRLGEHRWGWHDAAARLHGPAAVRVRETFQFRWQNTAALPPRFIAKNLPPEYFHLSSGERTVLNPEDTAGDLPPVPAQPEHPAEGTAVQVVRSYRPWSLYRHRGWRRMRRANVVRAGIQEIYQAMSTAIGAAERYIYLEDQYFHEAPGGDPRFQLYGALRSAARRGVKVILIGSGRKDPADGGDSTVRPVITHDLRRRVLDRLPVADRRNVVMYRIDNLTVHTKLMLVDDVFASIGSANFFSRSMVGTDSEITSTLVTTGDLVRDLRVRLWAEHLRTPLDSQLLPALTDLDTALGIWRREWLPAGHPPQTWRQAGLPAGFVPAEWALTPARYSPAVLRRERWRR